MSLNEMRDTLHEIRLARDASPSPMLTELDRLRYQKDIRA